METALVFELGTASRVNRLVREAGGTRTSGADFGEGGTAPCALAIGIALDGVSCAGGALKGTLNPSSPGGSLILGVGLVGIGPIGGGDGGALPACLASGCAPLLCDCIGAGALFFFSGSEGGGVFALFVPVRGNSGGGAFLIS